VTQGPNSCTQDWMQSNLDAFFSSINYQTTLVNALMSSLTPLSPDPWQVVANPDYSLQPINFVQDAGLLIISTIPDTLYVVQDSLIRVHASTQFSTQRGEIYVDCQGGRPALAPPDDLPPSAAGTKTIHVARVADTILNGMVFRSVSVEFVCDVQF
jgi:hypothetical protein